MLLTAAVRAGASARAGSHQRHDGNAGMLRPAAGIGEITQLALNLVRRRPEGPVRAMPESAARRFTAAWRGMR
jgi:hypothetical protein